MLRDKSHLIAIDEEMEIRIHWTTLGKGHRLDYRKSRRIVFYLSQAVLESQSYVKGLDWSRLLVRFIEGTGRGAGEVFSLACHNLEARIYNKLWWIDSSWSVWGGKK